jgi:hypothetical protein
MCFQAFLDRLEEQLDNLQRMCESPAAALQLLPHLGGIESGAHGCLLRMLEATQPCAIPHFDPLTQSCLRAIAKFQVSPWLSPFAPNVCLFVQVSCKDWFSLSKG